MKQIHIVLLLTVTLFIGCKSGNHALVPDTVAGVIGNGKVTVNISYDADFRIQTMKLKNDVGGINDYSFHYDNQKRILNITISGADENINGVYNFSYNKDTVFVKWLAYHISDNKDIVYINRGDTIEQQEPVGASMNKTFYAYDTTGNIMKVISMNTMSPERKDTAIIGYDDAQGVWKNINAPKWFHAFLLEYPLRKIPITPATQNNIISINGRSITYTYNKYNYPDTIKNNVRDVVLTIHYISKN